MVNIFDSKIESLFQPCLQDTCQSSTADPFSHSHKGTCTLYTGWASSPTTLILEKTGEFTLYIFLTNQQCHCFSKAPVCQTGCRGMQGH